MAIGRRAAESEIKKIVYRPQQTVCIIIIQYCSSIL